ncbi:MAG: zinc-binding dehydrogenase [Hyphomicrobiales bacterium]
MKAAQFHEHGDTANIRWDDFPDPECGADDVVIKVHAAALNGFEPMILLKTTALKTPLPMIVAGDGAGEIVELGANVDGWAAGDRVSVYPMVPGEGMTGETRLGICAEYHRIPATNIVRMPDDLSFEHAASLPIAYGTALRMMKTRGQVAAGEKVMILGAAGGVGTACVQLAKAAGAEVIACSSSEWKLEKLKEIGADHVVNTGQVEFRQWVWDHLGKPRMGQDGGVDVMVNYIGGDTWVDSLKSIAPGGRMLLCGATMDYKTDNDCRYIWTYEINIMGSNGWTMDDQAEMMRMAAEGAIVPVIDSVRPLSETGDAVQKLIDRDFFGKIVLVP